MSTVCVLCKKRRRWKEWKRATTMTASMQLSHRRHRLCRTAPRPHGIRKLRVLSNKKASHSRVYETNSSRKLSRQVCSQVHLLSRSCETKLRQPIASCRYPTSPWSTFRQTLTRHSQYEKTVFSSSHMLIQAPAAPKATLLVRVPN